MMQYGGYCDLLFLIHLHGRFICIAEPYLYIIGPIAS